MSGIVREHRPEGLKPLTVTRTFRTAIQFKPPRAALPMRPCHVNNLTDENVLVNPLVPYGKGDVGFEPTDRFLHGLRFSRPVHSARLCQPPESYSGMESYSTFPISPSTCKQEETRAGVEPALRALQARASSTLPPRRGDRPELNRRPRDHNPMLCH